MSWSLACPDWQDRLRQGLPPIARLPELNRAEAARAVSIFNRLRLPDVPGLPSLEHAAGDWFREIVRALHGSLDQVTRKRHVREVFTLVPKKNAKTSLGAALMLTSVLLNKRPKAEFLLVAPTQPISELAFKQVEGMVGADERLSDLFHVQVHLKKITHRRTGATLQVKSFDPSVLTGVKPASILMDELHVVSGNPNADRVVGQLRGGLISQPEGFLVFITTQSERPPAGVFKAELDKARGIRDGRIGGAMLPVLYEFPKDADWSDPENWWMVTPNRGLSITIDRLVEEYQSAVDSSKEELTRWASQHLNVEIGLALRTDRWAGADHWERQARPGLDLDTLLAASDVVTIGVDGGGLDDLLGFAVLGRHRDTREWMLWCRAWAHVSVLERRKSEASKLRDFERDGDLVIVSSMDAAFAEVADLIEQVNEAGVLASVGFDPVGVGLIVDELSRRGITQEAGQVQGVSQGFKLTGTIKTAEVQLSDGKMIHAGQPLMAWCVGNAKVEPKGNAIVITKQASGSAKIDPLMAAFNAVAIMAGNPQVKSTPSPDEFLAAPLVA